MIMVSGSGSPIVRVNVELQGNVGVLKNHLHKRRSGPSNINERIRKGKREEQEDGRLKLPVTYD